MKKLLTLALAFCAGVSAFAQGWTPSEADVTHDVTAKIGLRVAASNNADDPEDYSNPYWKGFGYNEGQAEQYPQWEYQTYKEQLTDPNSFVVWGVYNIPTFNVYQELENVPEGVYTVNLQGFYRAGQIDTEYRQWSAGSRIKNLRLYVEVETEDGTKEYSEYMVSICASGITDAPLYTAEGGDAWMSDKKYPPEGKTICYVPTCHAGFQAYLNNGCYDDNKVQFAVTAKTNKVRIGVRKDKEVSEDSSAWDNWRIFYDGVVTEDALNELAYQNFKKIYDPLEVFNEQLFVTYPALGSMLQDELMDYGGMDASDGVEALEAAGKELEEIENKYRSALVQIKSMDYLINVCQELLESTTEEEFPTGRSEFESALGTAREAVEADIDQIETIDDYLNAANDLFDARMAYLLSQKEQEGEFKWRNFSRAVSCSGLVNEKWTPYYTEDGEYRYPDEIENSWGMYHPNDGANTEIVTGYVNNRKTEEDLTNDGHPELIGQDMPVLADMAAWSVDTTDLNRWIYRGDLFKASVQVTQNLEWNKTYSSFNTGWTQQPSEGEMLYYQNVTSLPKGYYSLEGRVLLNSDPTAGVGAKSGVFIQSGDERAEKFAERQNNQYSDYVREAWEVLESDMIFHNAGETVQLGYTMNCQTVIGGVVLKYFGEKVNFIGLVEDAKQKVVTLLEQNEGNFRLLGDKPAVQALLDKVNPSDAIDDPSYKAALAILKEATDFINAAAAYNFNTQADYLSLQDQYKSEKEATILAVAAAYVDGLAESGTATYKDGQAADAMYKAYASYMKVFDQAEKLATEEINGILANQFANLSTYCDDASVLAQYELDLKNPIYKAIFANLHTEEATEANPVDVSVVLANPSFTEGVDGWDGTKPTQNEYANGNAEIYSQTAGTAADMYQKFQGLPAGKYKVTAQALYRDGNGSADLATCYKNWQAANGDKEAWNAVNNYNPVLYAKSGRFEGKDLINSVCDTKQTGLSFDTFYVIEEKGYPNDGKFLLYDQLTDEDKPYAEDYATKYVLENEDGTKGDAFQYPFDGRVDLEDGTSLFFPESMAGAALRFAQGEYKVEASVNVLPGEDLQLGIRKDSGAAGDWIIFDNFQLWYLGPIDESTPEPNPSANLIADEESYNFNKAEVKIEEVWGNKQYHVGNWAMTWNNNGGKATVDLVEPGYNKSAKALKLSNPEAGEFVYSAQLENGTLASPLLKGHNYVAKFYAKADAEGTEFQFSAEAAWDANVSKYQFGETVSLTTDWKEYTINICVPDGTEDGADASLAYEDLTAVKFNFGFMTGTAYVDRVLVYDAREEINPEGNLIYDDESFAFNGGTTGNWKMNGWNNAGTVAAVESGWNGSAYALELTPNGSAGQNYEAQVPNTVVGTMEVGKTYKLSFYAKAENEGAEIEFGAQLSPWAAGNKEWNGNMFALTTEWQAYSIEMTVTDDYPASGLNCLYINFGKTDGKAYVDHIVLEETIPAEVYSEDNMLDEASFGFEDGTVGQWHYLGWNNAGTFANAAPGYGSEGCMVLTSTKNGNPWDAQLLCPLKTPVMRGGKYQITFYAKSDAENEGDVINPGIAKTYEFPEWNNAANAVLTKEWQKFTYTLEANETNTAEDGNANFYFNHGTLKGNAYVDRVTVVCTESPETVINGVEINKASSVRYNLNGQAVGSDYKGTVIEGGKKFIVK